MGDAALAACRDYLERTPGVPLSRRVVGLLGAGLVAAATGIDGQARRKRKKKGRKKKSKAAPCGGSCGAGRRCVDGVCALEVCASCQHRTIQEAVNASQPNDTIALAAETFAGDVSIDRNLTVVGSGRPHPSPVQGPLSTVTGDATSRMATVRVSPGVSATFRRIWFKDNTGGDGGAIRAFLGSSVTISNSWFYKNHSDYGGAILNDGAVLTLIDTLVSFNDARKLGGGVFNRASGQVRLIRSRVEGNSAFGADLVDPARGGGIYNFAGSVALDGASSVSGNTPDDCVNTSACPP